MSDKPIFKTINSGEILRHIQSLIDNRNLGEEITYENRRFYFSYYPDPTVIFQDDINARSSVLFASQIKQMLIATGFDLGVKQKHKKR